jgi:TadE-like protein
VRSPVKKGAPRGAALAETALVVGVILIMILGSVQLGVVGYLQMTADAAAFLNAHQNAVGDVNALPATESVFPQFGPLNISASAAPAPAPTVYVDYGYNDPNPLVAAASVNNRHGGASMMEPTQLTSTVTKSNVINLLGVPLNVEGSMIEPQWLENGAHFDVANSPNYGQSSGTNFQENYFSGGENTPPYFVGYNYIENCPDAQPWATTATGCSATPGVQFRALGIAEHLDDSVWELPDGVVPGPSNPGALLAFAQVACHQYWYSQLATFFANNSSLGALQAPAPNSGNAISPLPNSNYFYWGTAFNTGFGAATAYSGPIAGSQADTAIQRIYSWDAIVTSGVSHSTGVGSNPFPAAYGAGAASVGTPYQYGTGC